MDAQSTLLDSSGVLPLPFNRFTGRRLGPYALQHEIAQGAMGVVYQARHERLQRLVALKIMRPGVELSPEDVQRFLREAQAAARLSHPNLVPIYDAGDAEGVRYLAMELVRGDSLHEVVRRRGPLLEVEALEYVLGAARGLEHAHDQGVLHRDLKPANVIIQRDGVARLTDFGLAKTVGEGEKLTVTGMALGTPAYMAPEQALGLNEEIDARSDIYGLGTILYECLTGEPPFSERSQLATMQAVITTTPRAPSDLRPGLSADLEAICLKCMQKEKEERYASCSELCADLEACLRGNTIRARAPWMWQRLLRRMRRAGLKASLLVVVFGMTAGAGAVVVRSLLNAGRPSQLEPRAMELGAECFLRVKRSLESALRDGDLEAQARILAEAAPERVQAELRGEFASGLSALQVAAVERGLIRGYPAEEVARWRAAAALALGRSLSELGQDEESLRRFAQAAWLDYEGLPGRESRLELARALLNTRGEWQRELAQEELLSLGGGMDVPAREAALELAPILAGQGRWGEVASLLDAREVVDGAEEEGEREWLLDEVSHLLAPRTPLPVSRVWALARLATGPARLVLAQRSTVRIYRSTAGAGLEEGERLAIPGAVERLATGDWTGDGDDELFVIQRDARLQRHLVVYALDPRWRSVATIQLPAQDRIRDLAQGDVNGDGRADLGVFFWDRPGDSLVVLAPDREGRPLGSLRPLPRNFPARQISAGLLVDLDGNGRDEIVVAGGEQGGGRLMSFVLSPSGGEFSPGHQLQLGAVTQLTSFPIQKDREGILAVVDSTRLWGPGRNPELAPVWMGRDGVYRLEANEEGKLAVASRWTYGLDQAPTNVSRFATRRLSLARVPLGGQDWLFRAAQVGQSRWLLEAAPLGAMSLGNNTSARLQLDLTEPILLGPERIADLGGDERVELVGSDGVNGLQDLERNPLRWQGETLERGAQQLRVARFLLALGRENVLEQLRGESEGDGEQEAAYSLLGVEFSQAQERTLRSRASQVFLAGESALGERLLGDSLDLARDSARRARHLAEDTALGGQLRAGAWEVAAFAQARAAEYRLAVEDLEQALALGTLLPRSRREALREQAGIWQRQGTLRRLTIDYGRKSGDAARWGRVVSPLLVGRTKGGGVRLRCEPGVGTSVLAHVDLGRGAPYAFEASLRTHGDSWLNRLEVGLFDFPREGEETPPLQVGFRFFLWALDSRQLGCRVLAGGESVGDELVLPEYAHQLRVRLEVAPRAGGGAHLSWSVFEEGGGRILRQEAQVNDLPLGRDVLIGIQSPRLAEGVSGLVPTLGVGCDVELDSLVVEALDPALVPSSVLGLRSAHAALALGEPAEVSRLYQRIHAAGVPPGAKGELLLNQAFALSRVGDLRAVDQLLRAVRADSFSTLARLEDAAHAFLHGPAADRALLADFVPRLLQSDRVVERQMGRHLAGEELLAEEPAKGDLSGSDQATLAYLRAGGSAPGSTTRLRRQPRAAPVVISILPGGSLSDEEFEDLVKGFEKTLGGRSATLTQQRLAYQMAAARPQRGEGWLALSHVYLQLRQWATSHSLLREALEGTFRTEDLRRFAVGRWLEVSAQLGPIALESALKRVEGELPPELLQRFRQRLPPLEDR